MRRAPSPAPEPTKREIELDTLARLYQSAHGKKITLATLGAPIGVTRQALYKHIQRTLDCKKTPWLVGKPCVDVLLCQVDMNNTTLTDIRREDYEIVARLLDACADL